jgi:hypothetical protein
VTLKGSAHGSALIARARLEKKHHLGKRENAASFFACFGDGWGPRAISKGPSFRLSVNRTTSTDQTHVRFGRASFF